MYKLLEDITPDDEQLSNKQALNAWNMLYKLMDNVKMAMSYTKQGKKSIANRDVEDIVNYIKMSLDNIVKHMITHPQKPNISKSNNGQQNIQNNSTLNENKKMKRIIRLNEIELKHLIRESVERVLKEY